MEKRHCPRPVRVRFFEFCCAARVRSAGNRHKGEPPQGGTATRGNRHKGEPPQGGTVAKQNEARFGRQHRSLSIIVKPGFVGSKGEGFCCEKACRHRESMVLDHSQPPHLVRMLTSAGSSQGLAGAGFPGGRGKAQVDLGVSTQTTLCDPKERCAL
eukprot:gene18148-biopygen23404